MSDAIVLDERAYRPSAEEDAAEAALREAIKRAGVRNALEVIADVAQVASYRLPPGAEEHQLRMFFDDLWELMHEYPRALGVMDYSQREA
jgi:hypothetical protein